jgi:Fe-S-cluster-containing dehydrogenase component
MVPDTSNFYIDPSRCIGCQSCVQACSECDTHKGLPMIHLEYVDRSHSVQTTPVVCMHCENPTCAKVCPADAIKKTDDGVVQSARKPRCIACSNCVLACPFGVPKMKSEFELMMKCDMCYDRTSQGKRPMCATVCPSQALFFGTKEQIAELRPRSRPVNEFKFGREVVRTKVFMMVPVDAPQQHIDVTGAMDAEPEARRIQLPVVQAEVADVMAASIFEPETAGGES